jgi:hypothetical protein
MRLASMKAVVGGGIHRKQRTVTTVTAATASTVRQRIRRVLERRLSRDRDADVTEEAAADR